MLEVQNANSISYFEIALVTAANLGNGTRYFMRWNKTDGRWCLKFTLQSL